LDEWDLQVKAEDLLLDILVSHPFTFTAACSHFNTKPRAGGALSLQKIKN
jgi:hypothetical protein